MESALGIPEVLDEVFQLAPPSTQAAAAQTCQYWSDCSLRWLWRTSIRSLNSYLHWSALMVLG
ncbi:hypothetical protein FRB95_013143 [Tulasnella sp. JGI-2019a]|nr:hypothetical protein FRB95_013143 [Tulasnella sp. JGI-2019a]